MNEELFLAMEWGYKACEKGWNLEKARFELTKVLDCTVQDYEADMERKRTMEGGE